MLTPQDVVSAYKLILGREPESAAMVDNFVAHADFDQLRAVLMGSAEFAERLGRDPRLLSIDMLTLAITAEVRRHESVQRRLVALPSPVYDLGVLLAGDGAVAQASFYLERRCKLWIAAPDGGAGLLRRILLAHPHHGANVTMLPIDLSRPVEDDGPLAFDLVQGELPDGGTAAMRAWLDNVAAVCRGTLVVTFEAATAHCEEVFETPAAADPRRMRSVATRSWVAARLRERFEHVDAMGRGAAAGGGTVQEIAVASRRAPAPPAGGANGESGTGGGEDIGRRAAAPLTRSR